MLILRCTNMFTFLFLGCFSTLNCFLKKYEWTNPSSQAPEGMCRLYSPLHWLSSPSPFETSALILSPQFLVFCVLTQVCEEHIGQRLQWSPRLCMAWASVALSPTQTQDPRASPAWERNQVNAAASPEFRLYTLPVGSREWEPRYKSCCSFHWGPVLIEQNLVRGYPIPNAELHPIQSLISQLCRAS